MNKNIIKFAGLIFFIVAVFILAKVFNLGHRIVELKDWIRSLGIAGPFVFTFLYILAVIFAVPGSAITVLAGALFGTLTGTIVVSIGSTTGAALAFLIARYFARGFIEEKFGGNEKFRELDGLTRKNGGIIVATTRLIPLFPFNLLNYGFGMTEIGFWTYVFWSWLCMLPGTIVYVAGADAVITAIKNGKIPWAITGVLVAAVTILVFAVRKATARLTK